MRVCAEDFAVADIMSGGRMIFGVGRRTAAREAESLGLAVSPANGGTGAPVDDVDRRNRKHFEEAMEVILRAWTEDRFPFEGDIFTFPPKGVDDRGTVVEKMTLVPRPLCYPNRPETWMACGSDATVECSARKGINALVDGRTGGRLRQMWSRWTDIASEARGYALRPGEGKMIVHYFWVEDSWEEAMRRARPSHDETKKWLAPYGRFTAYKHADGSNFQFGEIPALEESASQGFHWIGTPEMVAEMLLETFDGLGVENFLAHVQVPGMTGPDVHDQMGRFMRQVMPIVDRHMRPSSAPLIAAAGGA